jgi:hypothetical protein
MSPPDASHGEMPGFLLPGRPGGEHDEPLLDMIFDGRALPPDAPQEMHDLERMLAALAGPAEPGELAGEAVARAAFIRLASPAGVSPAFSRSAAHHGPRRPASHRLPRQRPARRRAGLAAALCAAAAVLVSTAAAYADVLPDPIQQVAHVTVGAPAPRHHGSHSPVRAGSRQDTRHGRGPAGRPARSADAAWSPGPADVAKPRHRPPWAGLQPAPVPLCGPGPWADQDQPGLASRFPPLSPQPRVPRCQDDRDTPVGQRAMNPHRPG